MIRVISLLMLAGACFAQPRADQYGDPLPERAVARLGTVRYRPSAGNEIESAALSPDPATLAVATPWGVTLCELETGRCRSLALSQEDAGPSRDIHYSPDGSWLLTYDHTRLQVFNALTGKTRFTRELKHSLRFASFLPTGDIALVEQDGLKVFVLDPATGEIAETRPMEDCIAILSPSGRLFIGQENGCPEIADVKTGRVWMRFSCESDLKDARFALSPDDRQFLVLTLDGRLRCFDAATGKLLDDVDPPTGWDDRWYGQSPVVSPDGRVAYVTQGFGSIHRRDLVRSRWLEPISGFPGGKVIPHPNGKELVLAGSDGVIYRIDLATRKELPGPHGLGGSPIATPSPDGRKVAVASGYGVLDLFDLEGKLVWSAKYDGAAGVAVWSRDVRIVASAGGAGAAVCDAKTGKVLLRFREKGFDEGFTGAVAFTPDGGQLIAVLDNGEGVVGYDLTSGKETRRWKTGLEFGIALSPDARTLTFENFSPCVALYDLEAGRMRVGFTLPAPPRQGCGRGGFAASYTANRFSPDGTRAITWTEAGLVLLWNADSGEPAGLIDTELDTIRCCAFSPDGLWLAVGSGDGKVSLWELDSGQWIGSWKGHRSGINSLAFLPGGRLVSTSEDTTALIWDVQPRKTLTRAPWDALSGDDACEAYRATWAMARDPKGVEFLRSQIAPARPAPADEVKRWLADLGAARYRTRELAAKELQARGRLVEPELRSARSKAISEEVRTRLDVLITNLPRDRSGDEIVHARAVATMELSGSDAARKLLAEWAVGAPGARLTVDAKAALARLGR